MIKKVATHNGKFHADDVFAVATLSLVFASEIQVCRTRDEVTIATADIVVDVLPDRNFSGTVTRVLHEANIQKNTLEVKVAIENPEPQIRPEMLARVRFLGKLDPGSDTSKEADRLFGPENAFKSSGGSSLAWVISDFDGKYGFVAPRSVKLGHIRKDGWVDVLEGLQPGDLVITRSSSELKNGTKVLVVSE